MKSIVALCFLLVTSVLLLGVAGLDPEDAIYGQVISNLDGLLKNDKLSNEERQEKLVLEIGKLFMTTEDIELTKEEVKKLSAPLSKWTDDLVERINGLKARKQEVTIDDIVHEIRGSNVSHSGLSKELGNVLKNKDEKKVNKFFSRAKSMFKRLGHELKEKLELGWEKIKLITKNPLRALVRATVRIGYSLGGLIGVVVFFPLRVLVGTIFASESFLKSSAKKAAADILVIYESIFKYHFDDVENIFHNYEKRVAE